MAKDKDGLVKELVLTPEERGALKKLAISPDFATLKNIIETFQQMRAYHLISGIVPADSLADYKGGFKLWAKVVDLVENAADVEALIALEETNAKEK